METSNLHTLKSILTEGIIIKGKDSPVEISCIYIPKIQRAYAQGRNEEADIRKDFLDALFDVLGSDKETKIELSFLFGSQQIIAKRNKLGFELLDGQQRTTTLFLLYWYISMKENKCVPDFLSKFTYDTRDTSTQFLANITSSDSNINIQATRPSDAIKQNKWFTDDYYCDPTVCAMMNMLDDIDKQYKDRQCSNIYDHLERLCFYVLMLKRYDMNDELYVKMNSRGLSLIPFENFKASIVKFMKAKERKGYYGTDEVINGKTPFWFIFISKMDATWIDLFWKYEDNSTEECKDIIVINDKEIGIRFLNFINRFLFIKSAISDDLEDAKLNPLSYFFGVEAESDKMKQRFFGWENYEKMFSSNRKLFQDLEKVLDILHSHWTTIKEEIKKDPYQNVDNFDIQNTEITYPQLVIFAAIIEFIKYIPDGVCFCEIQIITNFKRMLRVVFNTIENTSIENILSTTRVIKNVSTIIGLSGAVTDNFYHSLATINPGVRNEQLIDEIEKAKEMFSNDQKQFDPRWEEAFITAEQHPFFKGSIQFFFTPGAGDSNAFLKRYDIIKDLFDTSGIAANYRKDHILIRAIISCINYWEKGLEGRYITEVAEKEKYLKILLTRYTSVRKMFCSYFDNNNTEIDQYLKNVIENASPKNDQTTDFKILYKRLVSDPCASALFDWINEIENKKNKRFNLQYNYNHDCYVINISGNWHDRLILNTERRLIIPELINDFSMKYEDEYHQATMEGPIKDVMDWKISISKEINVNSEKYKLLLKFTEWKNVMFYVYGSDTDYLAKKFDVSSENKTNDNVMVSIIECQLKDKSVDSIKNEINRICKILVDTPNNS